MIVNQFWDSSRNIIVNRSYIKPSQKINFIENKFAKQMVSLSETPSSHASQFHNLLEISHENLDVYLVPVVVLKQNALGRAPHSGHLTSSKVSFSWERLF